MTAHDDAAQRADKQLREVIRDMLMLRSYCGDDPVFGTHTADLRAALRLVHLTERGLR